MIAPSVRSALRCSRRAPMVACSQRYFADAAVAVAAVESGEAKKAPRHTKAKEVLPALTIHKAIDAVKRMSWAKFDETIEISINTGLDPRKPNQSVKGVASLPYGTGKVVRVCVFATGNEAKDAVDAGAEVVGAEDLILQIQAGNINFDTVIATPEMMSLVGKLGKILGPRGLMPNPKTGTVTKDTGKAVRAAKAGAVKFKVEKKGIIQGGVGKMSFSNEALLGNIRSFMLAVSEVKPEGLKGKYLRVAHLSSSMGPGVEIELPTVDPGNARFMLDMSMNDEEEKK